jgi:Na+/proline symporter
VLILRWYWWRINAWSEISAMTASFVFSLFTPAIAGRTYPAGDPRIDSVSLLMIVFASAVVWVSVTLLTRPEPPAVLEAFYRRVRPGGPGWARISDAAGSGREPIPGGALAWTNWLAGVVAVYSTLFGIGKLILGEPTTAVVLLACAVAAFAWIARALRGSNDMPASA